jgi:1-deoxy-D-xylulose-5-phosphate synthase
MRFLSEINSPADLRQLKVEDLQEVADEVRQFIIDTCSRVGGHTGASLGAVELAVAMHYVFDTPNDRLVWDVGHQAYAHKILTGRRDQLHTIKQEGGISGFLRRDESEYDTFGAGHASTSISAALGMAVARDAKNEDFHVCALIGDSSLAGGMAMEAINQAGHLKSRLIVLLNDNEMSIAPAVGALSGYLNRIKGAQSYQHLKEEIGDALESVPGIGERLRAAAKSVKDAIAAAVLPGALVNELGFKYIGYVDGHNVPMLVRALEAAKKVDDGPVIVHALTTKGKGFPNPEKNYYAYHATGPFDPKTGLPYKSAKASAPTYTQVFGETMCELMADDKSIVALTAAMPDGTGVDKILEKFPERAFDVGIAGRCDLLDVFAARFRPVDPRRLPSGIERNVRHGPRRHSRSRRPDASRPPRYSVSSRLSEHCFDGTEGRSRDAQHDANRDRIRRTGGDQVPARERLRGGYQSETRAIADRQKRGASRRRRRGDNRVRVDGLPVGRSR